MFAVAVEDCCMICFVRSTAAVAGAVLRSKKMANTMWMRTMTCIRSIRHRRRRRLFLERVGMSWGLSAVGVA